MVEEATECRADAREKKFYPNPDDALGCDSHLYLAQYPQLYTGASKNGFPIFISKPGALQVDGIECLTTIDGILKYHWHVMMHDYSTRLLNYKKANPDFKRFECFCVLDLDHLSTAQLSKRALNIVKTQTVIDSLCFPETMNKMIITNAPRFFTVTWKIIKSWIDPRTVNKIEMFSSRSAGEKRLRELVDPAQLPSDYGGEAEDTKVTLLKSAPGNLARLVTEVMYIRSYCTYSIEVKAGQEAQVDVYTRARTGAIFEIKNAETKEVYISGVEVIHPGSAKDSEPPTKVLLTKIQGPKKLKIKGTSNSGRLAGSESFLVVCLIK